jgi:hypothetical protein
MSTHFSEMKQRIAALKAIAQDGRRTRQVRDAALRELKSLKAAKQRTQRGDSVITTFSPASAPQPRVMPAPVSILDDPHPGSSGPKIDLDAAEDDEPTEREDPYQSEREDLLEHLQTAEAIGNVDAIEPEYLKPSGPVGQQVDFAGSERRFVAKTLADLQPPDFWTSYPAEEIARTTPRKESAGPKIGKGWWEDW